MLIDPKVGTEFMKKLGSTKFDNDKNLIEILELENTSLWWWMEAYLYLSTAYRESFEEIIYDKPKKFNLPLKKYMIKHFLTCRSMMRKMQWKIAKPESFANKIPILIVHWHGKVNDAYIKPIINGLNKDKYQLFVLDVNGPENFDNSIFQEKLQDLSVSHILIENYFTKKDEPKLKEYMKRFKKIKKELVKNKNFHNLFTIDDRNIWKECRPQFEWFFDVRMKEYLMQFIAIKNIIEEIRPKVAIAQSETTELEKSLFYHCREHDIPTLALQNGLLNDIRLIKDKNHTCPTATKTCVYGDVDKKFLIDNNYCSNENIVVTGNPRWDEIKTKEFCKLGICNRLKIDPNKKIVVYATQPLTSIKNRKIIRDVVSDTIKKLPDIQFIVKVHHMENIEDYSSMQEKNVIIVKDFDVQEILFVCDSLLMVNSTIGLETLIFDKPLILLNEIIREQEFIDYGVCALRVQIKEQLLKIIKNSLYDKFVIDVLAKHRKQFIYDHCYNIDGKATERIINIIESFI